MSLIGDKWDLTTVNVSYAQKRDRLHVERRKATESSYYLVKKHRRAFIKEGATREIGSERVLDTDTQER